MLHPGGAAKALMISLLIRMKVQRPPSPPAKAIFSPIRAT
jgi:hypothetical protein